MNNRLSEYISTINKEFNELPIDIKNKYYVDSSLIEERKMRIGGEVRAGEAIPPEYDDIARASLKKDFINYYKRSK